MWNNKKFIIVAILVCGMILTDANRVVAAEGFGVSELEEIITN